MIRRYPSDVFPEWWFLETKTTAEALALIELIAKNQYMNTFERNTVKKGVMEVETVNALMAQLNAMNKKLEKLEASVVSTPASCGLCGGPHENHNCSCFKMINLLLHK
ncbi:hypothetical protein PIB30_073544 [Stylosanthes scabra]|uniref:Uncharacterized protein n=1 Tax=Stylosanthes scabra TaxID=79078 RepID=A0ABU6XMB0_9FABA|nr:hypothetical protein [Stylosanthes scabra]